VPRLASSRISGGTKPNYETAEVRSAPLVARDISAADAFPSAGGMSAMLAAVSCRAGRQTIRRRAQGGRIRRMSVGTLNPALMGSSFSEGGRKVDHIDMQSDAKHKEVGGARCRDPRRAGYDLRRRPGG
jgi:hypothetical protein